MKEYEYIVLASNEIFSHMISSVICLENYYNESIDNSFRNIFEMFNKLRNDYNEHSVHSNLQDEEDIKMEIAKFRMKCGLKREEILRSYIEELKEIDKSIEYDNIIRDYISRIEEEDVKTIEMNLLIYPYLLSLIRKNEEIGRNEEDGE